MQQKYIRKSILMTLFPVYFGHHPHNDTMVSAEATLPMERRRRGGNTAGGGADRRNPRYRRKPRAIFPTIQNRGAVAGI